MKVSGRDLHSNWDGLVALENEHSFAIRWLGLLSNMTNFLLANENFHSLLPLVQTR